MDESEPSLQYSAIRALHKETFDKLASEYAKRFQSRARMELFLLGPMAMYLRIPSESQKFARLTSGAVRGAAVSCSKAKDSKRMVSIFRQR